MIIACYAGVGKLCFEKIIPLDIDDFPSHEAFYNNSRSVELMKLNSRQEVMEFIERRE